MASGKSATPFTDMPPQMPPAVSRGAGGGAYGGGFVDGAYPAPGVGYPGPGYPGSGPALYPGAGEQGMVNPISTAYGGWPTPPPGMAAPPPGMAGGFPVPSGVDPASLVINRGPNNGLYVVGTANKKGVTVNLLLDRPMDKPGCPPVRPGQTLRGILRVTLTEATRVAWARASWSGKSKVSWTEGSGQNSTTYSARVSYAENEVIIEAGRKKGEGSSEVFVMPAGTHEWDIDYVLPAKHKDLPPAFQTYTGYIKYELEAGLKIDGKFWDDMLVVTVPMAICGDAAYEAKTGVGEPIYASTTGHDVIHTFCCFGSAGLARAFINVPNSAVVVSMDPQKMPIETGIWVTGSEDQTPLTHVTVSIKTTITFKANGARKRDVAEQYTHRLEIANDAAAHKKAGVYVLKNAGNFPAGAPDMVTRVADVGLPVPTIHSQLIDVNHEVYLQYSGGSCTPDDNISVPITVLPAGTDVSAILARQAAAAAQQGYAGLAGRGKQ
jgi:hypothetical protein